MQCEECRPWLPEYVEQEVPADREEEIRRHLEACSACRADLEALNTLSAAARALPRCAPGSQVVLTITEAIHATRASGRGREFGAVLDMDELAEFLRVDRDTVMLYLDEIPCFELGGKLLFRRRSIEDWLDQRESAFGAALTTPALKRIVVGERTTGGVPWTN